MGVTLQSLKKGEFGMDNYPPIPSPSPRKEGKGIDQSKSPSLFTGEGFGVGDYPKLSLYRFVLVSAFGILALAGCAGPQPIPTAVVVPPTITPITAAAVETRTPLPSITPSITTTAPPVQTGQTTVAVTAAPATQVAAQPTNAP